MQGRIWLESVVDQGSTFRFNAHFGLQHKTEPPPSVIPTVQGSRILVADDNATSLEVLSEILQGAQAVPTAVRSGPAALAELTRAAEVGQPYALVLIDASMPDKDGFATAKMIIERPEIGAPVLMMLDLGSQGGISRCREFGIRYHITKPILPEDLLEVIAEALTGAASAEAQIAGVDSDHAPAGDETLHVLLVDPEPLSQKLLARLLTKRGCSVVAVDDGHRAADAIQGQRFDTVLIDVEAPQFHSLEDVATIRRSCSQKGGRKPAIIGMGSESAASDLDHYLDEGLDDLLAKPVKAQALYAAFARFASQRKSRGTPGRNGRRTDQARATSNQG